MDSSRDFRKEDKRYVWTFQYFLRGMQCILFPFQPMPYDWCNKNHVMYYPVYGMMHIKRPLVVNENV